MTKRIRIAIIIAIVLSAAFTAYIETIFIPLEINTKMKLPDNSVSFVKLHDYDHDGINEDFTIANDTTLKRHHINVLKRHGSTVKSEILWITRNHYIKPNWLFFEDVNGDRHDEVILFNLHHKILYLSIYDIRHKRWYQENVPLLHQPDTIRHSTWDL